MKIFDLMKNYYTDELLFFEEQMVSLKAIIAIDSTVLGPALGNCILFNYKKEDDAVKDVLNMANYNTWRSALLRRNFGGGSVVLYGNPKKVKSEMYFRALGIILNKLSGKILLTQGTGVNQQDIQNIKRETDYILGLNSAHGGSGDTSSNVAKGVIWGIKAAVKEKMDKSSIDGLTIVVQGIGSIGAKVVEDLVAENTNIIITDLIYDKIKVIKDKIPQIKVVKPGEIYEQKCDVFCTCAYDNVITQQNASQLGCKILTGSVNEILATDNITQILNEKKIMYIPGFVINGGDIIQLANEYAGFETRKTDSELNEIYYLSQNIIRQAGKKNVTIGQEALDTAKDYIENVASIKTIK